MNVCARAADLSAWSIRLAVVMCTPALANLRFFSASWRAASSVTAGNLPSVAVCGLRSSVYRNCQLRVPLGETSKYRLSPSARR